ncbi:hypothetical protein [uncultured Thiodictyon sp.]|jgi:hypothetical protein|uniref:hypothetical protein n=1 Tax=uncultured Thiodictyon sp. TaxID=1846217 RepID=UPI0025D2885D|nr:hypothetical protein [uncultured Thiodictyon sp.]
MNIQETINKLTALPLEQQVEVWDFIEFLGARHSGQARARPLRPLRDEPFVGMWQDRKDMADSTAWVRDLRAKEWGV